MVIIAFYDFPHDVIGVLSHMFNMDMVFYFYSFSNFASTYGVIVSKRTA